MTVKDLKKQMRREVREAVRALEPAYCEEADERIADLIAELPEYDEADTIFCFVGTADEIDTMKLIRRAWEAGKRVGVPRCIKMGEMVVQEIRSEEDLENGSYGIREPKAECPEIGGGEIDFVIVPCMTCSHDGRRLGYGGGFYDRFLSGIDVPMAVICREKIMRDDIIMEAHDRRIGIVVSEKGIERN